MCHKRDILYARAFLIRHIMFTNKACSRIREQKENVNNM